MRRFAVLVALLALFQLAVREPGVIPARTLVPVLPRLDVVTHDARRTLRAGDRVTVTLRGTPGGSATFHIVGVVANVGMREIRTGVYQAQPALYTGTYIVRPGDVARNATLFGTLTVGGQEVMAASTRPLTVDTRPPAVMARAPKPGAVVPNVRPNILAQFFDTVSAVNPGAIRVSVNGQSVTARASVSPEFAAYNPEAPFAPGLVRVQVTASDDAGNRQSTDWSFRIISTTDLIRSVTINPATPLTPGDLLTVVMTGEPGGAAAFTIQGQPGAVAMRESRPGVYVGTLTATSGITAYDVPVRVTLTKGGRLSAVTAAVGVTILGLPPSAPAIVAPGRAVVLGEEAVARLVVRGRSQPGFRIVGRLFYVPRPSANNEQLPLTEFSTLAAGDGTWQVALGPVIALEEAGLFVSVVAIDPVGRRSRASLLELGR